MQQLTVEHKNPTSNQIVDEKILAKDRREGKGRVIALSRQATEFSIQTSIT